MGTGMKIKTITLHNHGAREIVTEDDKMHNIPADAARELHDTNLACGEEYPFEDDLNGTPVRLRPIEQPAENQ